MAVVAPPPSTLPSPLGLQVAGQTGAYPGGGQGQYNPQALANFFTPGNGYGQPPPIPGGTGTLPAQAGSTPASQSAGSIPDALMGYWNAINGQAAPQVQGDQNLLALFGQQSSLEGQLLGLNKGSLKAESNIQMNRANKMVESARAREAYERGQVPLINQTYNLANQAAGLQYGAARNALLSDATARGAVNQFGTVGQFKNQYGQFSNQVQQNLNTKNRSMADQRLALQQAQNLEQQYGLDKQDILQRMNNGLKTMGLQGQLDHIDILKAMNSTNADISGVAHSLFDQLMQFGVANPGMIPGITNFMGGNSAPGGGGGGGMRFR